MSVCHVRKDRKRIRPAAGARRDGNTASKQATPRKADHEGKGMQILFRATAIRGRRSGTVHLKLPDVGRGVCVSRSVVSVMEATSWVRRIHSKVFSFTPPAACSAAHVF